MPKFDALSTSGEEGGDSPPALSLCREGVALSDVATTPCEMTGELLHGRVGGQLRARPTMPVS